MLPTVGDVEVDLPADVVDGFGVSGRVVARRRAHDDR